MLPPCLRPLGAVVGALVLCGLAPSQGPFVNYEDPQVKPIAIASVGGVNFVLACNTPDNAVEVYQAAWPFQRVARVAVGLSPVTVRWNPLDSHFYTCNYLGDSVSSVRLGPVAITPTGGATVRASIERTSYVGDEPTDIVFSPTGPQAVVSLHSRGGMAMINLADLSVLAPLLPLVGPSPLAGANWGVKAPRRMAQLPDGRSFVLNTMGGEIRRGSTYDLGLYVNDPINPPTGQTHSLFLISGIGSTNFNFAIDGLAQRMFVVSQIAKNDAAGVDAVAAQPTGFVQTWLQILELRPGSRPQLVREQTAGLPIASLTKPLFRSINLNRDYSQVALAELPATEALAQATDVELIEGRPGEVLVVAIAVFGSDKVALLRPDGSQSSGWAIQRIAIPQVSPLAGYTAVGPRGLAYDPIAVDPSGLTRPGLLFCLNRLDNSLAVINPWNGAIVAQAPLANDPTPREIRAGRQLLYSATYTSGNAMVSCSSCHVDARTDALGWKLGNLDPAGPSIPPHLHDGDGLTSLDMPAWPSDKPMTVTQTLQGLVNYHVEPFGMQFITTNAPYHWRGDKLAFQNFNEAFVRLQHRSAMLTDPEMDLYAEFVDTIHHPPNPEQPKARTYGGATGNPDDPNDGSGALLGRKLFHTLPVVATRSCVHCHSLPDGSSNTLTVLEKNLGSISDRGKVQPFESAATRNLFLREMVVPQGLAQTDLTQTFTIDGAYGLLHAGMFSLLPEVSLSLNDFVHRTFLPLIFDPAKGDAVTAFLRQFDSGTAPMIGLAVTVNPANPAVHTAVFQQLEQQAREGNIGVAAHARNGVLERGFWYDVETGLYQLEGGILSLTRAQLELLGSGVGDSVFVQATPTGSERRIASMTGTPMVLGGAAPSQLQLLPMAPDTAFVGITDLTGNWDPNHPNPALRFTWDPVLGPEPQSAKSIRTLQLAVQGQFGVPVGPLRHEPPRRFRVSGVDIRNGAKLGLTLPSSSVNDPPDRIVWFDLAPTRYRDSLGRTVWETAEELDSLQTMAWLCGGYWAPGVRDVLYGIVPPSVPLSPATWNHFDVTVRNDDGSSGNSSNPQVLTIADQR